MRKVQRTKKIPTGDSYSSIACLCGFFLCGSCLGGYCGDCSSIGGFCFCGDAWPTSEALSTAHSSSHSKGQLVSIKLNPRPQTNWPKHSNSKPCTLTYVMYDSKNPKRTPPHRDASDRQYKYGFNLILIKFNLIG